MTEARLPPLGAAAPLGALRCRSMGGQQAHSWLCRETASPMELSNLTHMTLARGLSDILRANLQLLEQQRATPSHNVVSSNWLPHQGCSFEKQTSLSQLAVESSTGGTAQPEGNQMTDKTWQSGCRMRGTLSRCRPCESAAGCHQSREACARPRPTPCAHPAPLQRQARDRQVLQVANVRVCVLHVRAVTEAAP